MRDLLEQQILPTRQGLDFYREQLFASWRENVKKDLVAWSEVGGRWTRLRKLKPI